MKFSSSIPILASTSIALLGQLVPAAEAAVFSMVLDNIGHVRTDPILDKQCLSGHVHTFYGAKSLWPNTTGTDLLNTPPSEVSGPIADNKSLYWHPAVYRELPDGRYELVNTKLSVYYIWDQVDAQNNNAVQAFPPGFAMITGGVGKTDPRAALNFECVPGAGEGVGQSSFPTAPCNGPEDEFFVEFKMPNCWNGMPRDSQDSHVTYSLEGGNERSDPCPAGVGQGRYQAIINIVSKESELLMTRSALFYSSRSLSVCTYADTLP